MDAKKDTFAMGGIKFKSNGFSEKERIPFLTIDAYGNPYPRLLESRFAGNGSDCYNIVLHLISCGRLEQKTGTQSIRIAFKHSR